MTCSLKMRSDQLMRSDMDYRYRIWGSTAFRDPESPRACNIDGEQRTGDRCAASGMRKIGKIPNPTRDEIG